MNQISFLISLWLFSFLITIIISLYSIKEEKELKSYSGAILFFSLIVASIITFFIGGFIL